MLAGSESSDISVSTAECEGVPGAAGHVSGRVEDSEGALSHFRDELVVLDHLSHAA